MNSASPDSPLPKDGNVGPFLRLGLESDGESALAHSVDASLRHRLMASAPNISGTHTPAVHAWHPPSVESLQNALPQYDISRFIARGGMGAIYKGTQKSLRREVAIKVLPHEIKARDAQFKERFQQEAQAMARLSHPNIVAVFDAGETTQGLLYFVMEYVEGTDLAQAVAVQPLEPERAIQVVSDVCKALSFAHQRGIIHRDIKPSNIMLDKAGRVKVADFGLAKTVDIDGLLHTTGSMAMGTPDYISPEALIPNMKLDARADLYAVGVMLYQVITGQIPRGRFSLPSALVPSLDPRFDSIIDRAMQSDREKRYSTALEIKLDLEGLQTPPASAAEAPPSSTAQSLESQASFATRRRPSGTFYLAAALALACVVLAAVLLGSSREMAGEQAPSEMKPPPLLYPNRSRFGQNPAASRAAGEHAISLGASIGWYRQTARYTMARYLPPDDIEIFAILFSKQAPSDKITPADMAIFLQPGELQSLTLYGGKNALNEDICNRIIAAPNLQFLNLQQTNINDEWLAKIVRKMPHLQNLFVMDTGITKKGLNVYSPSPIFGTLQVTETAITPADVAELPFFHQIKILSLGSASRPLTNLAPMFAAGKFLDDLTLTGPLDAESLNGIENAPRLRVLTLATDRLTSGHFAAMSKQTSLAELRLHHTQVDETAWQSLTQIPSLRYLQLRDMPNSPALEAVKNSFKPPLTVEIIRSNNP